MRKEGLVYSKHLNLQNYSWIMRTNKNNVPHTGRTVNAARQPASSDQPDSDSQNGGHLVLEPDRGPITERTSWLPRSRRRDGAAPVYRSPLPGCVHRKPCTPRASPNTATHTYTVTHLRLGSALRASPRRRLGVERWRMPKGCRPAQTAKRDSRPQGHIRTCAHAASRPHSLCRPEKVPSTQYGLHGSLRRTAGAPLP